MSMYGLNIPHLMVVIVGIFIFKRAVSLAIATWKQ